MHDSTIEDPERAGFVCVRTVADLEHPSPGLALAMTPSMAAALHRSTRRLRSSLRMM